MLRGADWKNRQTSSDGLVLGPFEAWECERAHRTWMGEVLKLAKPTEVGKESFINV